MPGTVNVVPATAADAAEVARVHVASWRAAYAGIVAPATLAGLSVEARTAKWAESLAAGQSTVLVAKAGGSVAGWASFGACRDKGAPATEGEIWALYVDPAHWSRQVGCVLMQHALAQLQARGFVRCSLWVFPQNERAIRFYRKAGFAWDGRPPKTFELQGQTLQEVRYETDLCAPLNTC